MTTLQRVLHWLQRKSARSLRLSGLLGGALGYSLILSPSILPRPGFYLGLLAGLGFTIGYGGGLLAVTIYRALGFERPNKPLYRKIRKVVVIAGALMMAAATVFSGITQNEIRELLGQSPEPSSVLLIVVVAAIVAIATMALSRLVHRMWRKVSQLLSRWIPRRAANLAGLVLVATVGYWMAAGVAGDALLNAADGIYANTNDGTAPGVTQPQLGTRSGSPQSLAPWETLGLQGRSFVAEGPTAQEISQQTGAPALEPIRIYAGLQTADSARERAEIAVAELERTGAFDREILVVAGATGTGWAEPAQLAALEYMWGGDTAFATIQYSYLPSWLSFLVDAERATEAGVELFEAVHAKWAELPEDERPQLISYGLSLGSFAAQAPFAHASDVVHRADGALYVGTPNFTPMWQSTTALRDEGSPQWQPQVRQGKTVRFASQVADLEVPQGQWEEQRVVYLQHASDPVVWWSPDLLFSQPDWLAEPTGPDVTARMRWYPVLTFFQVTIDQFFGVDAPNGHGHNYSAQTVGAWAAVTQPENWDATATAELQQLINELYPLEP